MPETQIGFRAFATLLKVWLPNAVPDILSGARVGIGFALILSVVAEMLSSTPGLGNNVLLASRSFRSADLFAGIVLLGMLGAVSTGAIALLEQRLSFGCTTVVSQTWLAQPCTLFASICASAGSGASVRPNSMM